MNFKEWKRTLSGADFNRASALLIVEEAWNQALEEAALVAKRCECWYEGAGDSAASHAADEIRALKTTFAAPKAKTV